tara:strand:- start:196 stop:477 length:282 start_codon:yes stop_codon:yes gene_type:complete
MVIIEYKGIEYGLILRGKKQYWVNSRNRIASPELYSEFHAIAVESGQIEKVVEVKRTAKVNIPKKKRTSKPVISAGKAKVNKNGISIKINMKF